MTTQNLGLWEEDGYLEHREAMQTPHSFVFVVIYFSWLCQGNNEICNAHLRVMHL